MQLLFLCVQNSARSQMAEGLARALAPPGVEVYSAGSRPTAVRPEACQVLSELGIDISSQRSKSIEAVPIERIDTVITLCAEEVCPAYLGRARRIHWPIEDPVPEDETSPEERLVRFRRVRDEIRRRLEVFFTELRLEGSEQRVAEGTESRETEARSTTSWSPERSGGIVASGRSTERVERGDGTNTS